MKLCIALAILLAALCADAHGQSLEEKAQRAFTNLYPASVAAEVGAIVFDGLTSAKLKDKGAREAMPLFRNADGSFSARRFFGFNGALVAGKAALARLFPKLKPYLSALNFGMAAGHIASGIHNVRLPRVQIALRF